MISYLGVEDSVNTCDCCGKSNLKKTVALDIDGVKFNYGVICAGRALGTKTKNPADVAAAVTGINERKRIEEKVDELRKTTGENWVYGRFYIGRTFKTNVTIGLGSNQNLVSQIYPPKSK